MAFQSINTGTCWPKWLYVVNSMTFKVSRLLNSLKLRAYMVCLRNMLKILLGCYTVSVDVKLPTFRKVVAPSSGWPLTLLRPWPLRWRHYYIWNLGKYLMVETLIILIVLRLYDGRGNHTVYRDWEWVRRQGRLSVCESMISVELLEATKALSVVTSLINNVQ